MNEIGPDQERQSFSPEEYELIQRLAKARRENKKDLAYEDINEYEVPPRTQFPMLKKPAVTIGKGKLKFNMACIRLFEGIQYVIPIVNEKRRRLAIIPCAEEESASVDWARLNKDQIWVNKEISNKDLTAKIGSMMKWDTKGRYKILGELRMSARGLIMVFELEEAVLHTIEIEEFRDDQTGEMIQKKVQHKYYPEKYKGRIGMTYSDYLETHQMSMFEDFTNYINPIVEAGEKNE